MSQILKFFRSIYLVILFILIEGIAISHYAKSNSYTQAKILATTNGLVGGVQSGIESVSQFFILPQENERLTQRIIELERDIDFLEGAVGDSLHRIIPSKFDDPEYNYFSANVVSNSINKKNNFIVINEGLDSGIREKMAVVTPDGNIVGYVAGCSANYSAVLSILSEDFSTSGKIAGGKNFGAINWNRQDRYKVQMSNLSKYEDISVGDTIISTGFSQIFPPEVIIGTVSSFEFNEIETGYNVELELATDLTGIDNVIVIGKRDAPEVNALLEDVEAVDL